MVVVILHSIREGDDDNGYDGEKCEQGFALVPVENLGQNKYF